MSLPVNKPQNSYTSELDKIKSEPQRRIDATLKYVEAINDGTADLSQGVNRIPPRKYYIDNEDEEFYTRISQIQHAKYSGQHLNRSQHNKIERNPKPRYRRDKNNPKILHPYK